MRGGERGGIAGAGDRVSQLGRSARAVVQEIALGVWEGGGDFEAALAADARVSNVLDRAALAALFEPEPYLKHVDTVFARVFGHSSNEATDNEGSGRS